MSKKKIKFSNNSSKEELLEKLEYLNNYTQNEIPFTLVIRLAEIIGAEFLDKKKRGKGSQERFYHPDLEEFENYNGYMGIHVIHKGGNKVLIYKHNFKSYLYKPLRYLIIQKKD